MLIQQIKRLENRVLPDDPADKADKNQAKESLVLEKGRIEAENTSLKKELEVTKVNNEGLEDKLVKQNALISKLKQEI